MEQNFLIITVDPTPSSGIQILVNGCLAWEFYVEDAFTEFVNTRFFNGFHNPSLLGNAYPDRLGSGDPDVVRTLSEVGPRFVAALPGGFGTYLETFVYYEGDLSYIPAVQVLNSGYSSFDPTHAEFSYSERWPDDSLSKDDCEDLLYAWFGINMDEYGPYGGQLQYDGGTITLDFGSYPYVLQ